MFEGRPNIIFRVRMNQLRDSIGRCITLQTVVKRCVETSCYANGSNVSAYFYFIKRTNSI